MSERIEAGEAIRFYCGKCETEFEITHEPKVAEMENPPDTMPGKYASVCPFCGSQRIETV